MTGFPWRTALFISFALNLVLVSAAVGAYVSGARLQRPPPQGALVRPMAQRPFMQALPPETRRQLRRELADDVAATQPLRVEARAARRELYEAARAETYDPERMRAAFARVRAADAALQTPLHDAIARALADLPNAERRAAVEALNARPPGPRRPVRPGGIGEGEGPAPNP